MTSKRYSSAFLAALARRRAGVERTTSDGSDARMEGVACSRAPSIRWLVPPPLRRVPRLLRVTDFMHLEQGA
jgi:hypothetical protein